MQKIIPHLWFDNEAREAAEFYTSAFPKSRVTNVTTLHNTPSGDCDIVSFELWDTRSWQSARDLCLSSIHPYPSWLISTRRKTKKRKHAWIDLGRL